MLMGCMFWRLHRAVTNSTVLVTIQNGHAWGTWSNSAYVSRPAFHLSKHCKWTESQVAVASMLSVSDAMHKKLLTDATDA